MQQDWKAIWDNLNPDEAAKERMKQAILQKMQAETPQTASKKPPFFLQRCSFGTFARAAALCCMTVTVALAGLRNCCQHHPSANSRRKRPHRIPCQHRQQQLYKFKPQRKHRLPCGQPLPQQNRRLPLVRQRRYRLLSHQLQS